MVNKFPTVFIFLVLISCAESTPTPPANRILPLPTFSQIHLNQDFFLIARPGDNPRLIIEGEKEVIDQIELKVEQGILTLIWLNNQPALQRQVKLIIEGPCPKVIKISAGAQATIEDYQDLDNLILETEEQAYACLSSISVKDLDVKTKGRSMVQMEGSSETLKLRAAQTSQVFALQWEVTSIDVQALDFSAVEFQGGQSLGIYAVSKATVTYSGKPLKKSIRKLGAATVTALDEKN